MSDIENETPEPLVDEEGSMAEGTTDGGDIVPAAEPTVPCEFMTGCAGTGKTFQCRERIAADPSWGILTSTTGISAVNLGATTINSCLRFFNTDGLRDSYLNGALVRRLRELREEYRRVVVDEVSMMDGDQLGILVRAALECNSFISKQPPLGLYLTGDMCQLPPVKARWVFESDEWHRFESNTTRLTKVWRQDEGRFLDALNFTRAGNGAAAAEILSAEGLEWHTSLDTAFEGTTIVAKNTEVARYNGLGLQRVPGSVFTLSNRRWGKQRGEWGPKKDKKGNILEWGVPPTVDLKIGAYVMLLANSYDENGNILYANGDCAYVVDHLQTAYCKTVKVKLVRNGAVVDVDPVVRDVGTNHKPEGWARVNGGIGHGEWLPRPHWMPDKKRFVEGQIEMWPIRLAYCTSVHKSQSLSLDRVQCDIRDPFFAAPAMLYTTMSRCRTLQGLRVVGQRERYVRNCTIDPRVAPWL